MKNVLFYFPSWENAIEQKEVSKKGNFNLPQDFVLPSRFRSKHTINGEFISWHIIDYKTWKREEVQELSDAQKQLSPWGTWNDTLLKERLAKRWALDNWI
jgi:hypothetical protein